MSFKNRLIPATQLLSRGVRVRGINAFGPLTTSVQAVNTFDEGLSNCFDRGGYFNPASPDRVTVPAGAAGLYSIVAWAQGTSGNGAQTSMWLDIRLNGLFLQPLQHPPIIGSPTFQNVGVFDLAVGDYIQMGASIGQTLQSSGPDLRFYIESCSLELHLIGRAS